MTPTSNPLLKRALLWGGVVAVVIAVLGGTIGFLVAGGIGLVSALVGTIMAVLFMGITVLTILIANRFAGTDAFVAAFFGIVLGGWILKLVVFLVLVVVLRDQPWLQPMVLFLSIVAGVVGSLVVDLVVITQSRIPYVSDTAATSGRE